MQGEDIKLDQMFQQWTYAMARECIEEHDTVIHKDENSLLLPIIRTLQVTSLLKVSTQKCKSISYWPDTERKQRSTYYIAHYIKARKSILVQVKSKQRYFFGKQT
jgi:hypothetical protein